jgi:hypothetical protein
MAVYHVLLSQEPDGSKLRSIFTDLSERELKKKFVSPYRKGKNIVHKNEVILISSVRKLYIVQTARRDDVERAALHEESLKKIDQWNRDSDSVVFISFGTGYEPLDILEAGKDVTKEFIKGPPGYAGAPNVLLRLLNNSWVVGIGAAVISAAIVWWLKLN